MFRENLELGEKLVELVSLLAKFTWISPPTNQSRSAARFKISDDAGSAGHSKGSNQAAESTCSRLDQSMRLRWLTTQIELNTRFLLAGTKMKNRPMFRLGKSFIQDQPGMSLIWRCVGLIKFPLWLKRPWRALLFVDKARLTPADPKQDADLGRLAARWPCCFSLQFALA